MDTVFTAWQLKEKCREQHQDLFIAFNDLSKAFDTVNMELMWNIRLAAHKDLPISFNNSMGR